MEKQKVKAEKIEMTQIFAEDGTVIPVTKIGLIDSVEFTDQEKVDVRGVSKGKGFAGVVKRYSFGGGPKSHGQTNKLRAPGSIGGGTDPGRVWKGQKMPGRMGAENVTVKNLRVVKQEIENNQSVLFLKGAVPGHRGTELIVIRTLANQEQNQNGD